MPYEVIDVYPEPALGGDFGEVVAMNIQRAYETAAEQGGRIIAGHTVARNY